MACGMAAMLTYTEWREDKYRNIGYFSNLPDTFHSVVHCAQRNADVNKRMLKVFHCFNSFWTISRQSKENHKKGKWHYFIRPQTVGVLFS